jgi:N-methylhydantoinase A
MSDIRHDFVRTKIIRGDDINTHRLSSLYAELEAEASATLERDGVAQDQRHLERSADFRYVGQAYEVNVPVLVGELDATSVLTAISTFHETHRQLYAHNHPEKQLEFVSARVAAIGRMSAPPIRSQVKNKRQAAAKERRPVYFDELTDYTETNVYDRSELTPGTTLDGPAIVEQVDTTVLIHPGQKAEVDAQGNLLIHTGT